MAKDALLELDHDHAEFGELLSALRDNLTSDHADIATVRDIASELRDVFIDHFGEEEEVLFPRLVAMFPNEETRINALIRSHDVLCGATVRLANMNMRETLKSGEAPPSSDLLGHARTLLTRLEDAYAEHAQSERALLRELAGKMTPTQRASL